MAVRVMIAVEVRLYREGLYQILANQERIEIVATASCPREVLDHAASTEPDTVLLDMTMNGAVTIVRLLVERFPGIKVVALTLRESEPELIPCAEAGIAGYVTRVATIEDLVSTIESTSRGELRCSPGIAGALLRRVTALASSRRAQRDPLAVLTSREADVLAMIEQGRTNKEIARTYRIELATVKNHVHNLLTKLHVQRRGEAAALFRESRGFI